MAATLQDASVLWSAHNGPQSTFLASPAYEALYGGAAGGGKSDALLFGGLRQIDHPHYKALILRRTYPELRELMDRALEVMGQIGGTWNESGKRWTFTSGATLEFGYCDAYADVMRYQGQSYTYIAYDEIGQLKDEKVWTYLMSRNRAAHDGLTRWMRASANPGGPGHQWLKRRFINTCSPDGQPYEVKLDDGTYTTRAFVRARLADNPTLLEHDPGYASRLRLLPDLEYRWLADGDWDAGAGLGLAELSRDRHLIRPLSNIPSHWTLFGAFDWGYAHPFCFGLFAADEGGTVYLIESVHGRHLQPPEIVQRIEDTLTGIGVPLSRLLVTWAGHDCWADVKARAENIPTIFEHCARLGLVMRKANISRISGIQNIRRYLTWKQPDGKEIDPRFLICDTPSNRRVFECLEGIVSDPDNPEDALKVDADDQGQGGDDPYDMCLGGETLVECEYGPRPIAELVGKTGQVWTPWGLRPFHSVRCTKRQAPVWSITTKDGRTVRVTENHPLAIDGAWVEAGSVYSGDSWLDMGCSRRCIQVHEPDGDRRQNTRVPRTEILADTWGLLSSSGEMATSRGVDGESWTDSPKASHSSQGPEQGEQYRRQSGMSSGSSSLGFAPHISRSGRDVAPGKAQGASLSYEGTGMASERDRASLAFGNVIDSHAEPAIGSEDVRALRQSLPDESALEVSVLPSELQNGLLPPRGTSAIVASINFWGYTDVYNLEVDDVHCFSVAGGLIVHNCRYGLASRPIMAKKINLPSVAQDKTLGYDYDKHQVKQRPSADEEFAKIIDRALPQSPTVNRFRVPRR